MLTQNRRMEWLSLLAALCVCSLVLGHESGVAPSLDEALVWIKQVDAQLGKPRYTDLTA